MRFIDQFRKWFTEDRRQAVYVAVAAIVPVLVLTRTITEDQTEHVLTVVSVVLQVVAGVLALLNLTPRQAGEWFITAGRGALYALAALMAPAAVGLGWITEEQSVSVLTVVSVVLTALAAIVGVIFAKPVNK